MEKIKTEQEYRTYCSMMEEIIAKGTELGDMELLSKADKSKYIKLSTMIREWEKVHHKFPIQQNPLIEEIKTKMAEKHLRQRETAQLLEINESRFSEVKFFEERNLSLCSWQKNFIVNWMFPLKC